MDNSIIASAYSVAKIMGCNKPLREFSEQYRKYYEETLKELNASSEQNTAQAVQNPFRMNHQF